jgi:hypothetical protein
VKHALLHPLAVSSLVLLVANDHVFKRVCPSFVTGKLSDFAGVFLLPLVLSAAIELALSKRSERLSPRLANRVLLLSVMATMLGFTLVELWTPAETAYRHAIGVLQWPFWAAVSAVRGGAPPGIALVPATADATDLLALPMGICALSFGWRRPSTPRDPRPTRLLSRAIGLLLALFVALRAEPAAAEASAGTAPTKPDCFARGAYTHNGFYLSGGLGMGALVVDSEASISNGFQQGIPSSASGQMFPMIDLSIGGTLPDPRLVLGVRYVQGESVEPVIDTLDESFTITNFRIGFQELSAFASYYFDPHIGTHVGGSIGFFHLFSGESQETLGDSAYPNSKSPNGLSLSAEGGQDFWLMKEISAGVTLRMTFARLSSDSNTTLVFAPTLLGTLLLH